VTGIRGRRANKYYQMRENLSDAAVRAAYTPIINEFLRSRTANPSMSKLSELAALAEKAGELSASRAPTPAAPTGSIPTTQPGACSYIGMDLLVQHIMRSCNELITELAHKGVNTLAYSTDLNDIERLHSDATNGTPEHDRAMIALTSMDTRLKTALRLFLAGTIDKDEAAKQKWPSDV
jgi:hypothetical protein